MLEIDQRETWTIRSLGIPGIGRANQGDSQVHEKVSVVKVKCQGEVSRLDWAKNIRYECIANVYEANIFLMVLLLISVLIH